MTDAAGIGPIATFAAGLVSFFSPCVPLLAPGFKGARRMKVIGSVAVCIGLLAPAGAVAQGASALLPGPGFMPNPAKGKRLFDKNCAACHGDNLKGTDKGPPLLHRIYEPNHHSDVAIQLAVKNGSRQHHWQFGDMLPVAGLTREDVGHISAYIRLQQRKAGVF